MMLGGSPMSVAVPPMFDASISVMKNGMGLTSSSLHTVSVMGPMSSTVVTLSRNAESTAVSSTNSSMIFQGSPFASRAHLMARNSNTPDSFTTDTNSIMPSSTPRVLKSMCSMAASNGMTCRANTIIAPVMAASDRCSFSVMMVIMTTTNTATATIWLTSMKHRRPLFLKRSHPCAAHVLYYSNVYVEETGGFDDVCRQRRDVSRRTIPKKIKGGLRPASGRSEV